MTIISRAKLLAIAALLASTTTVSASPTRVPTDLASPVIAKRDATVTINPATIKPEVIDHGALDQAALDALIANRTAPSKDTDSAVQRRTTGLGMSNFADGPFFKLIIGGPSTASSSCKSFTFNGPIVSMEFDVDERTFAKVKFTSISGESATFGSRTASTGPQTITLGDNERFTSFGVFQSSDRQNEVSGYNITTDAGQKMTILTQRGRDDKSQTGSFVFDTGSGILAQINGTACDDTGVVIGSFGFLDALSSIAISNLSYSGFTNNLAPAGDGSLFTVGSQILDNRNSSIQQQMVLTTAAAVTKSRQVNTGLTWSVGNSVTATSEVSFPFIAKSTIATTVQWSVGGSSDTQDLNAKTTTNTAAFTLACPAKKYCVGSASFQTFKLDVDVEATFRATTKTNLQFTWVQKARYKGSDSLAMKLTIDEVSNP